MHSGAQLKEDRGIEDIWNWFDDQLIALLNYRYKIKSDIANNNPGLHKKFNNFLPETVQTIDEVDNYFDKSERNLEHLVCLDLITATEAIIRLDYLNRRKGKRKILLAKTFNEIYKKKGDRPSLKGDLIEAWQNTLSKEKRYFSDFKGLLIYRNWLAHGRYWNAMLGETYTPERTFNIVEKVRNILQENSQST